MATGACSRSSAWGSRAGCRWRSRDRRSSIWLKEAGVSLTAIGLFAGVGLAYTLKFLWAPAIDRLALPLLTRTLGRRRGWAIAIELALGAGARGARVAATRRTRPLRVAHARRTRRVPVGEPGHRHRCLSRRAAGRARAGRGRGGDAGRLSRRHGRIDRGRALSRAVLRLVRCLCRHGRTLERGHGERADDARAAAAGIARAAPGSRAR